LELSYLSKPITDAEFDELIETFCEIEDVSELVSFVINDLIRNNQQLAFYINQVNNILNCFTSVFLLDTAISILEQKWIVIF
jgi:hypothetical protein